MTEAGVGQAMAFSSSKHNQVQKLPGWTGKPEAGKAANKFRAGPRKNDGFTEVAAPELNEGFKNERHTKVLQVVALICGLKARREKFPPLYLPAFALKP